MEIKIDFFRSAIVCYRNTDFSDKPCVHERERGKERHIYHGQIKKEYVFGVEDCKIDFFRSAK